MNAPRNAGMAQNEHRRSQPDAIFSGATGLPPSRRRSTRGPDAGATPSGRSAIAPPAAGVPCPGSTAPAAARVTGEIGSSLRRSLGWCASHRWPSATASSRAAMSP